ncbi:MAG: Fe-S cluster assembly protein SufD, partial [Nitrososphaerales archaeon]
KPDSAGVPREVTDYLEEHKDSPFVFRLDNGLPMITIPNQFVDTGMILADLGTALVEHEGLIRPYLQRRAIPPEEDKFAAMNMAMANSGLFLYLPGDLQIDEPIRLLNILDTPSSAIFHQLIVVADERSRATIIEENYSSEAVESGKSSAFSSLCELYLNPHSDVSYSCIQGLGENVVSLSNRRAVCSEGAHVSWTLGHIGGQFVRSRLDSSLQGYGATSEDLEIIFGDRTQIFDMASDLTHRGIDTNGTILSRGVMKDSSRATMKGMINISQAAKNAEAYLGEHAMLLGKDAKADAIPGLEISTNEVKATHAASVSQIDEEAIFYLMTRALSDDEAKKALILGFVEPAIQRIPSMEIRQRLLSLINSKWEGVREVLAMLPDGEVDEDTEKPVKRLGAREFFERHYKYE